MASELQIAANRRLETVGLGLLALTVLQ